MKRYAMLLVFTCLALPVWAGYVRMGLAEAIKKKTVRLTAVNTQGAYRGKTTTLQLTSNDANNTVLIMIDIGTLLQPDSNKYQPLLLAGEETLELVPLKTAEVRVETFCDDHDKRCPVSDHGYRYGGMASDTMIAVLKFIRQHQLFDELGQHAVWAARDRWHLPNVYDGERIALSAQLLAHVCKVTGNSLPEYKTVNAPAPQVSGAPAYEPKPLQIIASFRLLLEEARTLTLGVYNGQGEMIQSVFENKEFPRAGHEFDVEFEAADVPAGFYYIRLSAGATILQEKKVRVQ